MSIKKFLKTYMWYVIAPIFLFILLTIVLLFFAPRFSQGPFVYQIH